MRKLKLLSEKVKRWSMEVAEATSGEALTESRRLIKGRELQAVFGFAFGEEGVKHRFFRLIEEEARALKLKCKSIWA